jgi:hypothetical protein
MPMLTVRFEVPTFDGQEGVPAGGWGTVKLI